MSELIERLKAYAAKFGPIDPERAMCLEAVAEIERLRSSLPEREWLREALEWIAAKPDEGNEWDGVDKFHECRDHARAALWWKENGQMSSIKVQCRCGWQGHQSELVVFRLCPTCSAPFETYPHPTKTEWVTYQPATPEQT
jgi:hypothetical protein